MSEAAVETHPDYGSGDMPVNPYGQLHIVPEVIDRSPESVRTHDNFAARANDIIMTISHGLQRGEPLREAIGVAADNYVDNTEDDPELQKFSHLIVRARKQAEIQDQLNEDRRLLHGGTLDTEEDRSLAVHYDMLRHEACEYNHELRRFIEDHSEDVGRDELTDWLIRASQGRVKWADGEITGAVSEAAVHAALQGMPELRGLRHGTVDEDLKGFDFVGTWQGRLVTFDAKTGHYPPLTEQKHGHPHIELSVPRIEGFRLSPHELDNLRFDARHALHEHVGIGIHSAHRRDATKVIRLAPSQS